MSNVGTPDRLDWCCAALRTPMNQLFDLQNDHWCDIAGEICRKFVCTQTSGFPNESNEVTFEGLRPLWIPAMYIVLCSRSLDSLDSLHFLNIPIFYHYQVFLVLIQLLQSCDDCGGVAVFPSTSSAKQLKTKPTWMLGIQLKYHTCDPLQTQLEVFKLGAKIRQLSMIIRHV